MLTVRVAVALDEADVAGVFDRTPPEWRCAVNPPTALDVDRYLHQEDRGILLVDDAAVCFYETDDSGAATITVFIPIRCELATEAAAAAIEFLAGLGFERVRGVVGNELLLRELAKVPGVKRKGSHLVYTAKQSKSPE